MLPTFCASRHQHRLRRSSRRRAHSILWSSCRLHRASKVVSFLAPRSLLNVERSGVNAFYVGKPNPLMVSRALEVLGCLSRGLLCNTCLFCAGTSRRDTVLIGDRMNTDIIAGVEAEIDTLLTLSGVTETRD